jgi:hypothetical protein
MEWGCRPCPPKSGTMNWASEASYVEWDGAGGVTPPPSPLPYFPADPCVFHLKRRRNRYYSRFFVKAQLVHTFHLFSVLFTICWVFWKNSTEIECSRLFEARICTQTSYFFKQMTNMYFSQIYTYTKNKKKLQLYIWISKKLLPAIYCWSLGIIRYTR